MKIGILALQGDVSNHSMILGQLDVDVVLVKTPSDLGAIDGIVIPGGESTTMSMLLQSSGLAEPLAGELSNGFPALGTCAGMILLARTIIDGRVDQTSLGAIDITVRRNGFGRQIASFETDIQVSGIGPDPMRAVFIRAPIVEFVGNSVDVLASVEYQFPDLSTRVIPVICKQEKVFVSSFHPEIVGDDRLHKLFLEAC